MNSNLIWLDLEMTGLNPERHVILEIAVLVSDEHLNILAEGPDIAIKHPDEALKEMDSWNREHHQASGLLDRVRASSHNTESAEKLVRFGRIGVSCLPICLNLRPISITEL